MEIIDIIKTLVSYNTVKMKALFLLRKLLTYVLNVSISPVKLILSIRTLSTFSFSFSSNWNTYMTKTFYYLQHILSNVYNLFFFFFK